MKKFRLYNNIVGWVVFAISAVVYLLTLEPTASFWDCPEFISTAFKLEVGHPPGAPFFMLMGHFFSLFAKNVTDVAFWVNSLSAWASAFTILFLFWTITHLARKVVHPTDGGNYSLAQIIGILGAGLVGALTYTFTDSFWFSAVEGEVYASSAVFTAVVFWAILKWEDVANEPHADRWIIMIAYLMGLSIGVHLLNLLTIPAIVLVYYFKKYPYTAKGVLLALLVSFVILGLVMYGVVPGVMTVASWFELLFVNVLGFSFNTGFLIYCILMFAAIGWSIYETFTGKSPARSKISFILTIALVGIPFIGESIALGIIIIAALVIALFFIFRNLEMRILNTIMIALATIMIGYSSYAIIVIRSAANPPMDQNSPDNVFSLKSYLNREQYGDRPLFYGQYYNAELETQIKHNEEGEYCAPVIKDEGPVWSPKEKIDSTEKDTYIVSDRKRKYVYNDAFCTIFPRMYSSSPSHVENYKIWADVVGKTVTYTYCGQQQQAIVPTFGENLRFFFTYQIGYMYMRYFAWNFIGRQSDLQGSGEIDRGWIATGIPFVDNLISGGDVSKMPTEMKENKGRNVYYMLPFLLGILGIFYQLSKGKKGEQSFWITLVLFFMTGLAIVLYLNQTPLQPRERDYAYAGSFYAYAIWIGFGVLGLSAILKKIFKNKIISASVATLLCMFVPIQMGAQNWDDHDRSGRYTCRDFGYNYLISCAPNSIIFTNGDNDTFPLWYLQEVEGVRRDVRVCNLSYLQTDWYIDQMRRQAYESEPLPISWKRYQYVQGVNDVVSVDKVPLAIDAKEAIERFVLNPDVNKFPTNIISIPVDKNDTKILGVAPAYKDSILTKLDINLKPRLYKHELMILEMLAQNEWKRPIYFSVTVGNDMYMGLDKHLQLEGLAYRIVPIQNSSEEGVVDTDVMFDNMVHKFRWGGDKNGGALRPDIYMDENNMRMCRTFRLMFYQLVDALIKENKNDKALEALDHCMKVLPVEAVPVDGYVGAYLATQYYRLGENEKGDALMEKIAKNNLEYINWYSSFTNPDMIRSSNYDLRRCLAIMENVLAHWQQAGRKELFDKYVSIYEKMVN